MPYFINIIISLLEQTHQKMDEEVVVSYTHRGRETGLQCSQVYGLLCPGMSLLSFFLSLFLASPLLSSFPLPSLPLLPSSPLPLLSPSLSPSHPSFYFLSPLRLVRMHKFDDFFTQPIGGFLGSYRKWVWNILQLAQICPLLTFVPSRGDSISEGRWPPRWYRWLPPSAAKLKAGGKGLLSASQRWVERTTAPSTPRGAGGETMSRITNAD